MISRGVLETLWDLPFIHYYEQDILPYEIVFIRNSFTVRSTTARFCWKLNFGASALWGFAYIECRPKLVPLRSYCTLLSPATGAIHFALRSLRSLRSLREIQFIGM